MKAKLTPVQIDYMSRYYTASNVGTMWTAEMNHSSEGIDLGPELRSWIKLIKQQPAVWTKEFVRRFGEDALTKLV